jgi:hypothetical protein
MGKIDIELSHEHLENSGSHRGWSHELNGLLWVEIKGKTME